MRRNIPEIVLGALLAVAVFAMGFLASSVLPPQPPDKAAYQEAKTEAPKDQPPKTFWQRTTDDPVAFFTLIITIFTGVSVFSNVMLWLVTGRTLAHGRETAQRQLRAYVSVIIGGAVYQERDKSIRFEGRPVILNTGQTPAHDLSYWANAAVLTLPIPPGFPFEPRPGSGFNWFAVLGPQQTFIASAVVPDFVDDGEVESIKSGPDRGLCVWGRVIYRDAFGEIHQTEFSQVLWWLPDGNIMGHYERHNRAT